MKLVIILAAILTCMTPSFGHKGGILDVLDHIHEMAETADKKYESESRKILRSIKRQSPKRHKKLDEDPLY